MPGPGKKPPTLRAITGSRLKNAVALVELPALSEIPNPPEWLTNARGLAEWRRLAPILHANRLLTEAGVSALGCLCATHGAVTDMFADGDCPPAHTIAQYRAMVNDFGMTPVAQSKVKQFGQEAPANRFAKFGKPSTAA